MSLAKDATNVAFITGADYASQMTYERLCSTERYIKAIKDTSQKLEDYYMSVNLKAIKQNDDSDKKSKANKNEVLDMKSS